MINYRGRHVLVATTKSYILMVSRLSYESTSAVPSNLSSVPTGWLLVDVLDQSPRDRYIFYIEHSMDGLHLKCMPIIDHIDLLHCSIIFSTNRIGLIRKSKCSILLVCDLVHLTKAIPRRSIACFRHQTSRSRKTLYRAFYCAYSRCTRGCGPVCPQSYVLVLPRAKHNNSSFILRSSTSRSNSWLYYSSNCGMSWPSARSEKRCHPATQ